MARGTSSPIERFAEAYKLVAVLRYVNPGRNWMPPGVTVSYGLESRFDRQRFNAFKGYVQAMSRSPVVIQQRDQRIPLPGC